MRLKNVQKLPKLGFLDEDELLNATELLNGVDARLVIPWGVSDWKEKKNETCIFVSFLITKHIYLPKMETVFPY